MIAARGGDVVAQVVDTMKGMDASRQKITGVIDGVAFQAGILGLSAAVQAVRAGGRDRGVAVVAGGVHVAATEPGGVPRPWPKRPPPLRTKLPRPSRMAGNFLAAVAIPRGSDNCLLCLPGCVTRRTGSNAWCFGRPAGFYFHDHFHLHCSAQFHGRRLER